MQRKESACLLTKTGMSPEWKADPSLLKTSPVGATPAAPMPRKPPSPAPAPPPSVAPVAALLARYRGFHTDSWKGVCVQATGEDLHRATMSSMGHGARRRVTVARLTLLPCAGVAPPWEGVPIPPYAGVRPPAAGVCPPIPHAGKVTQMIAISNV